MSAPIIVGDGIAPARGTLTISIAPIQAKVDLALEAYEISANCGGNWSEHPEHEVGDWAMAIASEQTRLGYWEWVASRIEFGDFELDSDEMGSPDPYADFIHDEKEYECRDSFHVQSQAEPQELPW